MQKLPRVVLLLESSRGSGRALLRGFANYARYHGPWAFYWEPGGLNEILPRLARLDAQGIILRDGTHIDKVLTLRIPTVVVGHRKQDFPGVAHVVTDSETAGRLAVEHLLGCGFKHFGFCGCAEIPWSVARGASFCRHVEAAGRKVSFFDARPRSDEADWRAEQDAMAGWLKSLPKPVGVMACNDDYARHIIEACKVADLHVPDQVGVIGADNDELVCELSAPSISSVAINFERAGYESAKLLDEWMRRGRLSSPTRIIAPTTHVVPRSSTDMLAAEDPHLAKALRFIREHARDNVRVTGVARAAGLSRRALENRFRTGVRRTVLQEIRRVRVEVIARMLVETQLPVSHIADALGYENVQHIARYFRKEKRMSPVAFRKLHGSR